MTGLEIKGTHLKCKVWSGCLEGIEKVVGALIIGVPHVKGLHPAQLPLVVKHVHVHPSQGCLPSLLLVEDTEAKTCHPWDFTHLGDQLIFNGIIHIKHL